MSRNGEPPAGGEAAIQAAVNALAPFIDPIIARINVAEFTTTEFIQALQLDPETRRAYDMVVTSWPEQDPHMTMLVIHGQVIPQLLRTSVLVEWAGFAYGEEDPYGVPAWWRKVEAANNGASD